VLPREEGSQLGLRFPDELITRELLLLLLLLMVEEEIGRASKVTRVVGLLLPKEAGRVFDSILIICPGPAGPLSDSRLDAELGSDLERNFLGSEEDFSMIRGCGGRSPTEANKLPGFCCC